MNNRREAAAYLTVEGGAASCSLCPHFCIIPQDSAGFCGVRRNDGGILYAENYGRVSALNLDPIEKKPLRMYKPGTQILSVGGYGCNLRCPHCQNSGISLEYGDMGAEYIAPERIAELAVKYVPNGNIGVAYTYNEPLIGFEYVLDCAESVHKAGLVNVLVTNGFINRGPLLALLPFIGAMNIDVKGFTEKFYGNISGKLDAVKNTVELAHKHCHVEVTTLIIPDENDGGDEITELCKWLASVNDAIPLHLTRFYPRYKYGHKPPTDIEVIIKLRNIAEKYLKNIFI